VLVFVVYVPASHVEIVKQAMFSAGAGHIGEYSECAWQVLGEGQFSPSQQATPYIGSANQISKVPEYRVEMVCKDELKNDVLAALRSAHPYEEPAYHVLASVV